MSTGKWLFVVFMACCVAPVYAASYSECEKAKLKQLKTERSASGKISKAGGKGPSKRRQNADKLDEWLWRNCGNYAHELRNLEQQRM